MLGTLSTEAERVSIQEPGDSKRKAWGTNHREAIDAYNEYVIKRGPFADDLRCF